MTDAPERTDVLPYKRRIKELEREVVALEQERDEALRAYDQLEELEGEWCAEATRLREVVRGAMDALTAYDDTTTAWVAREILREALAAAEQREPNGQ